MSVIARKIAIAAHAPTDRSDPVEVAHSFVPALKETLEAWLSVEDVTLELAQADWALPEGDVLTGQLISCRGASRTQRAAICVSSSLADYAVLSLLRLDADTPEDRLAALRPFAIQNLVAFGDRLSNSGLFIESGDDRPLWTTPSLEDLNADFAKHDLIHCTWQLSGLGDTPMAITLILTHDMRPVAEDVADDVKPMQPHLPPRLGPCHVDVRAVGDRVRLSVAECTRLEIGQTIGLKGLRFDKLELDVDMGEGRLPLTDAALGAEKGQKAVRLNRGLDPAFREAPNPAPSSGRGHASARPVSA